MTQPDTNLPPYDYDEIDLRDIFKTLGKWKKVIAGVTILCMLLSGVYSFFVLKPIYEARALFIPTTVNAFNQSSNLAYIIKDDGDRFRDSQNISNNINQIIKFTQVDVNHYKVALTSNYILQSTIDNLKLDTTLAGLKGRVKVEDIKNTAVSSVAASEVVVQSTNPQEAAQIANYLVQQTALYLNEMNRQKMSKLLQNLEAQQKIEKQELDQAFANLSQYRARIGNTGSMSYLEASKLQNEVNLREDMVNSLSSKILQIKVLQSFESAEDKVVVLSAATAPENPVKPNKKQNVVIAGVLGLMVSVFGVFLIEYLKKEDE